jgi:hypothetical protein
MELGCYVMADASLGKLAGTTHYHLDTYADGQAAEAARGPNGTVVVSLDKVSLFTIADSTDARLTGSMLLRRPPYDEARHQPQRRLS